MSDFKLHINGFVYSGWTQLRVTRSLEQLASSFSVSFTDRWEAGSERIPIEQGDDFRLSYNGETIITGWVIRDMVEYDDQQHTLSATGRSLTGDLVDCAAIYRGGQWRGRTLLQIAEDLCEPFGITASANVSVGAKFRLFELDDGETVFQALTRAAKRRGVLLLTDVDGNLVFDRVGSSKVSTQLRYGRNIKRGSRENSGEARFSSYKVKAQTSGNDNLFGASTSLSRTSTDDGVLRYRPTIITADDEDSGTELQKRADWERNTRAGQSKRVQYTVQGWEHDSGLWEPNTLIRVVDERLRLDDELLIVEASQERSESLGSVTNLTLTFPEAFDVQPLPPPKEKEGSLF